MQIHRRRAKVLTMATVALVLAGSGLVTGVAGAAKKASLPPIVLGGLSTLTTANGAPFPGVVTGVNARIAQANKQGGIDGRKIKYVGVQDDGGTSTTDLNDARKLVLTDHVFAVVPVIATAFLSQTGNFLAENHVPFFGWGFLTSFCNNVYGYGFNGCLVNPAEINLSIIDPILKAYPSIKTVAYISANSASFVSGLKVDALGGKLAGLDVVYDASPVPATSSVTDFTPYAQALMTANNGQPPGLVVAAGGLPMETGLFGALKALGYKGQMLTYSTYVPGLLESSPTTAQALATTYADIQFQPQEGGGKAITEIENDLKAINVKPTITEGMATAFWSTDMAISMLTAAAKKVGAKNLTPATFQKFVNGGYTYTPSPAGGVGPVTWPTAHSDPSPCAALVGIKPTKYFVKEPMACYKIATTTSA